MSNSPTSSPTSSPTPVSNYNNSGNLLMYIVIVIIVTCWLLKNIVTIVRERRELNRRRILLGIRYDVEMAQYDFSNCFDEKTFPDLTNEQNNCIICLDEYKESEKVYEIKKCKHSFHKYCINKWLNEKSVCPICRAEVIEI